MHAFHFHNPCRIIFGAGSIERLAAGAARLGKSALLVHGRSHLEKSGLLERIVRALEQAGVRVNLFGGVFPNPTFALAAAGIEECRKQGCGMVIGAGGASVLDTARAIAAGVPLEGGLGRVFAGKRSVRKRLPLLLAPTMPGAGSATGCGMALRDPEKEVKLGFGAAALHADLAIIDPETMITAPQQAIAAAAVDAFSHALEFAVNHAAVNDALQLRLLAALARTVTEAGKEAVLRKEAGKLAELAWAGELVMQGMCTAGLGWTAFPLHAVEHGISGVLDSSHGQGLALLISSLLARPEAAGQEYARFFRCLFPDVSGDDANVAERAAEWFNNWAAAIGLDTEDLREKARTGYERIAAAAAIQARRWRIRDVSRELSLLEG